VVPSKAPINCAVAAPVATPFNSIPVLFCAHAQRLPPPRSNARRSFSRDTAVKFPSFFSVFFVFVFDHEVLATFVFTRQPVRCCFVQTCFVGNLSKI
jgi:hypothetical protein